MTENYLLKWFVVYANINESKIHNFKHTLHVHIIIYILYMHMFICSYMYIYVYICTFCYVCNISYMYINVHIIYDVYKLYMYILNM